jgi:hypothetical protein
MKAICCWADVVARPFFMMEKRVNFGVFEDVQRWLDQRVFDVTEKSSRIIKKGVAVMGAVPKKSLGKRDGRSSRRSPASAEMRPQPVVSCGVFGLEFVEITRPKATSISKLFYVNCLCLAPFKYNRYCASIILG